MKPEDIPLIADVVAKAIKKATEPLHARIALLEGRETQTNKRLEELETRPAGVEYAGVFENGKAYAPCRLVTKNGGLWLSLKETMQAPGMDPLSWKLICKEGRAQP